MSGSTRIYIPSDDGRLACEVHFPRRFPAPVIVCCHGLLSSKGSTKYLAIAEELVKEGMIALRFDFSGCGESTPVRGKSLLGAWGRDLEAVLDYVRVQPWSSGLPGLLGSSMGGYIALHTADKGTHPVRCSVCWATPFELENIRIAVEESGELEHIFPPGFRLGAPQSLASLGQLRRVLVIHGQEDEVVDWRDSVEIFRRLGEPRNLVLMSTADHRILDPMWRRVAVRLSVDWLKKRMSSGDEEA